MADSSRSLDLRSDPGYVAILSILQAKEDRPLGLDEYRGCRQSDFATVDKDFKNPERISELMDYGLVFHIRLPDGERSYRYELTEDGRRELNKYNRVANKRSDELAKPPAEPAKPAKGIQYTKTDPKTSKGGKRPSVAAKGSRDEPIDKD